MKGKKIQLVLWGFIILSVTDIYAQDPQFSQFFNSSLYYNPATAGISQDLRFSSAYRNLWSNIPGDLSTYFISADYQWSEKNVGIGFLLLSDNEGLHTMRTQRMELIYSYRIQNKYRMLQFGMSAFSINIKDFKNASFIFTDQLDPIHGVVQQSSFINEELEPIIYPDWNVGMVYRENFKQRKLTPTLGISASHIFRPNISFVNDIVRLPVKYVVHSSVLTQVAFNKDNILERKFAYLNPGFVYEYQEPFQTFTIGSGFDLYPFRLGMWFRNQSFYTPLNKYNSVIIHAGIVVPLSLNHNLIIDYTYDTTISKLEYTSGGAHEITVIYNISLPEKKHAVPCFSEWWRVGKGIAHYPKSR